jgi:hypothetical protein
MSKMNATVTPKAVTDYIRASELVGLLDPHCKMCVQVFYPLVKQGRKVSDIFAPSHRPSDHCQSGKRPHCTCDRCF